MPGTSPLLSGLDFRRGLCAHGRGRCRAGRASSGHPLPPAVMPGLVPGIHVPPPPRPRPARTAMPHGVDARNKSTAVRFRFSARAVRPWAGTMPGGAGLLRRSSPSQPSCPDLFRASTSRRRLARARLAPRCLTAWMPGTSPGMTRWGKAGRDWGRRRETPAYRNPSLDPRDPPETRSYSSLLPRPKELNRTAMEQVRA